MERIAFHTEADLELKAAAQYYEKRVAGRGEEFLDEVENALIRIQQFPSAWPVYEGEYRCYYLQHFPYGLVYRVESDRIFVLAVAHLRRQPGYWRDRQ